MLPTTTKERLGNGDKVVARHFPILWPYPSTPLLICPHLAVSPTCLLFLWLKILRGKMTYKHSTDRSDIRVTRPVNQPLQTLHFT